MGFEPQAFKDECFNIADWWLAHALDHENGGFYGAVSFDNVPDKTAHKSIILNSRILWFFSVAAQFAADDDERRHRYNKAATRIFQYLVDHFIDSEYGGVYWMLDAKGQLLDGKKHTYAQGFSIYAFSAYYDLTQNQQALDLAVQCFELIELHAKDNDFGGHFEARSQNWGHLEDISLSEKEDNSPKTMNTNLHVLEAYTGLHSTVRDMPQLSSTVAEALATSLQVFCDKVVNIETGHTKMFMNEQWLDHSQAYSFGHDIESSWLIFKAIKSLRGTAYEAEQYIRHVKMLGAIAYNDGLQADGSMGDEYEINTQKFAKSSWWAQAEAMVGLATMWRLGEGDKYKEAALRVWVFACDNFIDHTHGEWFWYSKKHQQPEVSEYKVGPWKAPYHTGRAMMQMYELLKEHDAS